MGIQGLTRRRANPFLIFGLIVCACLCGCRTPFSYVADAAIMEPIDSKPVVQLIKTGCYGMCPSYHLSIWENGLVVFGYGPNPHDGIWWRSLDQEDLRRLRVAVRTIPGAPCGASPRDTIIDAQRVTLVWTDESERCQRDFYSGQAPTGFSSAVDRVLDLTGARSLTHERRR
jgi:hypothetical protein